MTSADVQNIDKPDIHKKETQDALDELKYRSKRKRARGRVLYEYAAPPTRVVTARTNTTDALSALGRFAVFSDHGIRARNMVVSHYHKP